MFYVFISVIHAKAVRIKTAVFLLEIKKNLFKYT